MKVLKTFGFCLLLLLIAPRLSAQFLYWEYTNVLDEPREGGSHADMVQDAAGNFHITFWHQDYERLVYGYRPAAGGPWTFESVDSLGVNGWVSSLALDGAGNPVVAYFESWGGENQLRISRRTGAFSWVKELLPGHPSRGHWGHYGPGDMTNVNNRLTPAIDLVITSGGETHVFFQDMHVDPDAFPYCTFSSGYGLRMWQAHQEAGVWRVTSPGEIEDLNLSCGGPSGSDYPLPYGDWYGNFVSALENPSGGLTALTPSRFNTHVLLFETTTADTVWDTVRVDTMETAVGFGWGSPIYQLNRYFTWENTVADFSDDGTFHSAYSSSLLYGDNFCCVSFNTLIYTRKTPSDTVYTHIKVGDSRYLTQVRIHAISSDTVVITYSNLSDNALILQLTTDGGATWQADTIAHVAPTSGTPMTVHNDTVSVLYFDWIREELTLARRGVYAPIGTWTHEPVRRSEFNGESLDAAVVYSGVDTTVYIAYNEGNSGKLFLREGTRSGSSWLWSVSEPDTTCTQCTQVKMLLDNAGERLVFYNGNVSQDLMVATTVGGGWILDTVVAGANPLSLSATIGADDTVHIAYYDGGDHRLHHAWGVPGTVWYEEMVDASTERVGDYCSIKLGPANQPMISYYNDSTFSLMFAERIGGTWDTTLVYSNKPSAAGKFTSLGILGSGQPAIAFLDEQNHKVWLAERDTALAWNLSLVDSAALYGIGRPTQLEIDKFGNPWVAYNYASSFDRIRIMHRDTMWREVTVGSTGYIAKSFRFIVANNDLYLVGTKTLPGNTGLGMLYAPRGLYVDVEEPTWTENTSVIFYPNPNQGTFKVEITLQEPEETGLMLLNLMGQPVVQLLAPQQLSAGTHTFEVDASQVSAGIYLLQSTGNNPRIAGKVVLTHP